MPMYSVVRLISDGFAFIPKTKGFEGVDLRKHDSDTELENSALETSLNSFSLKVNLRMCQRMSTIVDASDPNHACIRSAAIFDEVLNHIFLDWHGLEELKLLNAGYVRNLETNEVTAIQPEKKSSFPVFHLAPERYPQIAIDQWLSFYSDKADVARSLTRSLHWRRLATFEEKQTLKFLFNWISIETLTKLHVEDDVVPKIMIAFGFPTSKYAREIDRGLIVQLKSHKDYDKWYRFFKNEFIDMRSFRNNVVHSGFREVELS